MWCVGLFNSVYVQWNLYYNCKFIKFDTKLNVQIPVEFRSKVFTGTGTKILFRYRNRNSGQQIHEAGGEQWTPLPKRNLCSWFTKQGVSREHSFPNEICAADLRGRGWTVNTPSQTNLCSRFTRQGVNSEHPFPNEICAADSRGRGWAVNTPSQTISVQQIHEAGGEQLTSLPKRNLCSRSTGQGVNSEHPFPNEIWAVDSRDRGWAVNTQTKSTD